MLIAILLPVISKARRHAERVACASNLRQLGQALLAYAQDNDQFLPLPADYRYRQREDWVHWQVGRVIDESSLWSYLGKSDKVLRCPGGVQERAWSPYPYSYSINAMISGIRTHQGGQTEWERMPVKLTKIRRSSSKILVYEENTDAIDDGGFDDHHRFVTTRPVNASGFVSVRHDGGPEWEASPIVQTYLRRGNVLFLDGHCGFVQRRQANSRYHDDPLFDGAMHIMNGVPEH